MLIYDALKQDHDALKPLLNELIESAKADEKVRERVISQIRDALVPHSRAEEAVFYSPLRDIDGTKDLVSHSYTEHMEAETMLRSLQMMETVNADWTKLALKLKDALFHHIQTEEGQVFPAAKQVLAVEEAQMMGAAFEKLKPEVREEGFVANTADLIANLLPKRFEASVRNFIHKPH